MKLQALGLYLIGTLHDAARPEGEKATIIVPETVNKLEPHIRVTSVGNMVNNERDGFSVKEGDLLIVNGQGTKTITHKGEEFRFFQSNCIIAQYVPDAEDALKIIELSTQN